MNEWISRLRSQAFLLLLIVQCAFAQQAADWEKDMQAFAKADRMNPPHKGGIVFTGSSSIRLWPNLSKQFPNRNVINRGFGGSHLSDVMTWADQVIFRYEPRQVVVYAGDNDIANGNSAEKVAQDFARLFQKIRGRLPSAKIAFISIKPSPSRVAYQATIQKANQLIQNFLKKQRNAAYIDVFSSMVNPAGRPKAEWFRADSLHMNEKGYEQWAKKIGPYLVK